jgi:hypothetical protein
VLVAASRAFLGLRVYQKRLRPQKARAHGRYHKKHNEFCEALHHWIVRCLK